MAIEDTNPGYYGLASHAEMHECARFGLPFAPSSLKLVRLMQQDRTAPDYDVNEAAAGTDYNRGFRSHV